MLEPGERSILINDGRFNGDEEMRVSQCRIGEC
jgi:hypothetical protein